MSNANVGEELIRRGWTQGSLIDTADCPEASLSWNRQPKQDEVLADQTPDQAEDGAPSGRWEINRTPVKAHDYLVVVSHPCDIIKPDDKEPFVEAIPAHWTSDPDAISNARPNSIRHFILRRREGARGQECLIADSALKLSLRKATLLGLTPQEGIPTSDVLQTRQFRMWLAKRYDRPALPDNMVLAIQKPIIEAFKKLPRSDKKRQALDGIREILFWASTKQPPFEIVIWFLLHEAYDPPITDRVAANELAGWMGKCLAKVGDARIVGWDLVSLAEISLGDYLVAGKLSLDEYSPLMQSVLSAPTQTASSTDEPTGL